MVLALSDLLRHLGPKMAGVAASGRCSSPRRAASGKIPGNAVAPAASADDGRDDPSHASTHTFLGFVSNILVGGSSSGLIRPGLMALR